MVCRIILLTWALTFSINGSLSQGKQEGISTSISAIRANPFQYEGKVVKVVAWTRSNEYSVSLESDDFNERIRLREPDSEKLKLPSKIITKKDALYHQFWEYVDNEDVPDSGAHGARVELVGYVRLLKTNGKLAKKFQLNGQWPIEIICLHIKKLEIIP
jgi:hypothetical protein